MRISDTDERKLNKIVSKLPRKIAACVELEIAANVGVTSPKVVHIDDFKNSPRIEKTKGLYYFGQSVPMRFVYQIISNCSYSDTYSGEVYLPIGKGMYLRLVIFG